MIAHINPGCSACSGEYNCNKYCPMRVGRNIETFIENLDSIETRIGETQVDAYNPKSRLMICGQILEKSGSPTAMLRSTNNVPGIIVNNKLCDFMGLTAIQHLNTYCNYKQVSSAKKAEVADKLKKFNSNKCVPCPVSPGVEISVKHEDFYGKKIDEDTFVEQLRWELSEIGDLVGSILVPVRSNKDGKQHIKLQMSEYLTTWKLPNLERNLTSDEIQPELIKMTSIGFIKPLVLRDNKYTLAVDSTNLYINRNGIDLIIGYWDKNNRNLVVDENAVKELKNSKAYRKLAKTVNYIWRHHRFMIPYGLTEPNEIECK